MGLALGQQEIKSSLGNCIKSGENINVCLTGLAESLRPYMRTGINVPGIKIEPTEPMYIEEVTLKLQKPPVNVTVNFKETYVTGLSTFKLNSVRANKNKKTIRLNMTVPQLSVAGNYTMTGKAFITIKDSFGGYQVVIKQANVIMDTQLNVTESKRLFVSGEPKIKVTAGDLKVNLDNLFGRQAPQLAKTILTVVNQDSDKFIEDFGPQITSQVASLATNVYNEAVKNIDPSIFGLA